MTSRPFCPSLPVNFFANPVSVLWFPELTRVRTCVGGRLGHCAAMSLSTTMLLALIAIVTATGETGEKCFGFIGV